MVRAAAPMARAAPPLVTAAWTGLGVHPLELRLENTLENGQCFGWRRQPGDSSEPVWVGVLGEHVLALRQTEDDCMFRCVGGPAVAAKDAVAAAAEEAAVVTQLRDYFQLDEPLRPLYSHWAAADHRMAAVAEVVPGMRVLRQDPAECLFSFICSSNNNIGRISGMLQNLRAMYGTPIPTVDAPVGAPAEAEAAEAEPDRYYTFPSVQSLAAASDADLRSLGMGYRADYIRRSAQLVESRGVEWLWEMRTAPKEEVRSMLCELPGVGPKVADCVALFSLDQAGTVPVDTHVWQIACRDLDPALSECKSLTPTVYERVGLLFMQRYGARCGWAHCLLFAAELPQFRKLLPEELQREMEAFKAEEKEQKAREKERIRIAREAKLAAKGGQPAGGKGSDLLAPDYDLEGAENAEGAEGAASAAAADATLAKPKLKSKRRPPKATPSEPCKRKGRGATRAEGEVVD